LTWVERTTYDSVVEYFDEPVTVVSNETLIENLLRNDLLI